jgi:hypothetical protein
VHQLRAIPELAGVPVIFLTALGKDESKLRELGLGPDDYLAKPFRFSDLEKRVEHALATAVAPPVVDPAAGIDPSYGVPPGYAVPYPGAPYPGYPAGYPPGTVAYPPGAYPYGVAPPVAYPYPAPGVAPPRQPTPAVIPTPLPPSGAMPPPVAMPAAVPPAMPLPVAMPPVGGPPAASPPSHLTPSGQFPAQHRSTAMSGRLEQLGLSSLLVMMEMERKDGVLTLKELDSGAIGRIFLRHGHVVSARIDAHPEVDGRSSVYEMLTWKAGAFSFNAMEVEMEDTVQSSTTHLLMEGARLMDEANR